MRNLEWVNCNYGTLALNEKLHFEAVLNDLDDRRRFIGRPLRVFRGDDFGMISRRLAGEPVEANQIFERAFMIGDKARSFSVSQEQLDGRDHMLHINDCSEETLAFIFDRITNVLNVEPRSNWEQRVLESTSESFRKYFCDQNKQSDFVGRIRRCRHRLERIHLRDYFLFFLHVAGSRGIRDETFFVSTSRDRTKAEEFARKVDRRGRDRNRNPIITHYYIPHPYSRFAISPRSFSFHASHAVRNGMHTYDSEGIFPDQQEVSAKGALFPHFMLGIERLNERQFIVNPHLFETPTEQFAKSGCSIGQGDFQQWIRLTNYQFYGENNGEYQYRQYRV